MVQRLTQSISLRRHPVNSDQRLIAPTSTWQSPGTALWLTSHDPALHIKGLWTVGDNASMAWRNTADG
jgi:hypothetical protein